MSSSPVALRASPSGRTLVLAPQGEQGRETLPALQEALGLALHGTSRAVVVDLQHVPALDRHAALLLVAAHRQLAQQARDLLVVNVLPAPAHRLALVDADHELLVVRVERVFGPAWDEPGARQRAREP